MKFKIWCTHDGRWILSSREGKQRNWRYFAEGKTPNDVFVKMPYSAGLDKDVKIFIEFLK